MKSNLLTVALIAIFIFLGQMHTLAAQDSLQLEVTPGKTVRDRCVVRCMLPDRFAKAEHLNLLRGADGKSIPVQVETTATGRYAVWLLNDPLPPNSTRKYALAIAEAPSETVSNAVSLQDDGKNIQIKVGKRTIMTYRHALVPSPLPDAPYYARSGYIHPLFTPSGQAITDDFNPDHAHQHGIMFAWRKVLFDGRENNGWDQKSGLGRVEHVEIHGMTGGPVFGDLTVRLRHVDLTASGGPVTMLNETWKIRVYAFAERFVFDIVSTQVGATNKPVSLQEIHYGGMTIRGAAEWFETQAFDYLTSQGKTKTDGNHTRPNWVSLHGPLHGKSAAVTIFDHPDNFRFPQPVRLHPTMPYFCFVPAQQGAFSIEPDKPFVSRYRYYVHDGDVDPDAANRNWNDYANPPEVRIVPG